eukprot:TRINITY_DN32558_c0_g1_i1.p1 TRINITY_DN32558_c0_g1~~TRINITY_DN32558_c0_g1_i1.p1  ORF type:complete len:454 (-),score=69.44 TRINITY_DN32558_c0_g1_i1:1016-2377(-)
MAQHSVMTSLGSCRVVMLMSVISLAVVSGLSVDAGNLAIARFRAYLHIATVHPVPDYVPVTQFLLNEGRDLGLQKEALEFVQKKPVILLTWPGSDPLLPSVQFNSHVDVVPAEEKKWKHKPFSAYKDENGDIYARGSQDMKCVGMQYLEAVRVLKASGFTPLRTIHITFVPDEEIGGHDGAEKFVASARFQELNVGLLFDEGLASPTSQYRAFYGEKCTWWLTIKAEGAPGHGSKNFDGSASENLLKSLDVIYKFRAAQFDLVKAGLIQDGEAISVNVAFLKAGTPTPTGFVMNLQPSEASAGLDIRMPPLADEKAMERRIAEEWAPAARNMSYKWVQKVPTLNKFGKPAVSPYGSSSPWWPLLEAAVIKAGKSLAAPEVFPAATDARYYRQHGIPAIGFSPMSNTPILLHDHNEFLNEREYLDGIAVYVEIFKAIASAPGDGMQPSAGHGEL